MTNGTINNLKKILQIFRIYHRYEVVGMDKFPSDGGVLLVTNHSLATYDGFLLGLEILDKKKRLSRGLGDDLLFKIPFIKDWSMDLGIVPASMLNAKKLLKEGEVLGVAPGGMREALRPSKERYQLKWHRRKGFIRLAIEMQVPIVLAACPSSDRIFKVYESFLTAFAYNKFKIPLPLFKGYGLSYFPRPVKLTHYLSGPIYPPEVSTNIDEHVESFHRLIVKEMEILMQR